MDENQKLEQAVRETLQKEFNKGMLIGAQAVSTVILDKVNSEVVEKTGNVVYLDKNADHMFELNNKVRLINVNDFSRT